MGNHVERLWQALHDTITLHQQVFEDDMFTIRYFQKAAGISRLSVWTGGEDE